MAVALRLGNMVPVPRTGVRHVVSVRTRCTVVANNRLLLDGAVSLLCSRGQRLLLRPMGIDARLDYAELLSTPGVLRDLIFVLVLVGARVEAFDVSMFELSLSDRRQ